jgi:hypothetical protein
VPHWTQGLNKRDASVFDLYRLDTDTFSLTLDTVNPGDVSNWLLDYDFQVRVRLGCCAVLCGVLVLVSQVCAWWKDGSQHSAAAAASRHAPHA